MLSIGEKNSQFIDFVQNIIINDKVSHAYIVEICDYDMDLYLVNSFIKLILCKNKCNSFEKLNCGKCNICTLVDDHNYPDIRYIVPDGKEIKKGQLLDLQRDYINKSLLENKRIYVIEEAEKLNVAAANTLLKFLEEPADDVIAILLTNNRYKVIETILSRCQVLTLGSENLEQNYSDDISKILSFIVNGDNLFINYNDILNLIPDKILALNYFRNIENIFLLYLRTNNSIYNSLTNVSRKKVIFYLHTLENEISKLEYNVNYKLWLDALFAKLIGGDSND